MTEQHECEWRYAPVIEQVSSSMCNTPGFYCTVSGCDKYLLLDQAETRLNEYETLKKATEMLSAEDARWVADVLMEATNNHGVEQKFNRNPYYLTDVLKAYANMLEGKDG